MADTDPVAAPDSNPAYAQGDQDAEPTMTAPPGQRPDAATDPDGSASAAEPSDAEGTSYRASRQGPDHGPVAA